MTGGENEYLNSVCTVRTLRIGIFAPLLSKISAGFYCESPSKRKREFLFFVENLMPVRAGR